MQTTPQPAQAPKAKSGTWKLIAIVIVILVVVGVAAYILTQKPAATVNVNIQDDSACGLNDASCNYSPASYNATVNGAAVVWKNNGGINHTVTTNSTLNGNLPTFDSSSIAHGNTYQYAFTTAGTYHYYCTIHPWMKGTIVVS